MATVNDEGGLDLTQVELACLAQRLVARLLVEVTEGEHITWEDLPELSERAWEELGVWMESQAQRATDIAGMLDAAAVIDSIELLERVRG